MDSSGPLLPDTNLAPVYLIPCGILTVIGVGLCVARVITRLYPSPHVYRDDYMIIIATIFSVFGYIISCIAAAHGWGHLSPYVSQTNQIIAFKFLFAGQVLWIFATALVRISVACSLLRLGKCIGDAERLWKWCLLGLIGVQFLASTGWLVLLLFGCHPLRGMWKPVPKMTCWARKYSVIYGWVGNVIAILVDFILATMPIQLIRTLHRSLREKILINCLMAMGLFATGIAAYKITFSLRTNTGDPLSTTVEVSLWCKLEEQVGIIAACLPCVKAPMERLLYRIGILKSRFGGFSAFAAYLNHVSGHSPSAFPQDISMPGIENINRNSSDAGLFTNPDQTNGTIATAKSTAASSRTAEFGSEN